MARHRKYDLLDHIVKAITDSGWNTLYLASVDEHPFRLQVYREDESYRVRIYVWNLTHGGGRARPEDEYRIQITGTDCFTQTPGAKTLVLGWWEEVEVFAGFDVRKHSGVLGKSPSIQIREAYLRRAYIHGFSPCDKGNQELAIAFRPDFLVEYIRNLEALHDFGQYAQDLNVLDSVSKHPEINEEDIQIADRERKMTVVSVRKRLRDSNFRDRVLRAYGFHCAVCGIQLKLVPFQGGFDKCHSERPQGAKNLHLRSSRFLLWKWRFFASAPLRCAPAQNDRIRHFDLEKVLVDAAHIIPVNHENSTDETSNGMALCPLHHRAYDHALITIEQDYQVLLNEKRVAHLQSIDQSEGLDRFRQNLRPMILLPPATTDRPHVEYIRIANQVRGWE